MQTKQNGGKKNKPCDQVKESRGLSKNDRAGKKAIIAQCGVVLASARAWS